MGHHHPAQLRVTLGLHLVDEEALGIGAALEQGLEGVAGGAARDPLDGHGGAGHGLAGGQGGHPEGELVAPAHGGQRQVGDRDPDPGPAGPGVQAPHPHQVGPRRVAPREARQVRGQIEAEGGLAGGGGGGEGRDPGDRRRAQEADPPADARRRGIGALGGRRRGRLPGARGPLRLVDHHRPVGEGPEAPVQGVHLLDAQVHPGVAPAGDREHLGPEALHHPVALAEPQVAHPHREEEGDLGAPALGERPAGAVVDRRRAHRGQIAAAPDEVALHPEQVPVDLEAQVRDRRVEAHQLLHLAQVEVHRRRREPHDEPGRAGAPGHRLVVGVAGAGEGHREQAGDQAVAGIPRAREAAGGGHLEGRPGRRSPPRRRPGGDPR